MSTTPKNPTYAVSAAAAARLLMMAVDVTGVDCEGRSMAAHVKSICAGTTTIEAVSWDAYGDEGARMQALVTKALRRCAAARQSVVTRKMKLQNRTDREIAEEQIKKAYSHLHPAFIRGSDGVPYCYHFGPEGARMMYLWPDCLWRPRHPFPELIDEKEMVCEGIVIYPGERVEILYRGNLHQNYIIPYPAPTESIWARSRDLTTKLDPMPKQPAEPEPWPAPKLEDARTFYGIGKPLPGEKPLPLRPHGIRPPRRSSEKPRRRLTPPRKTKKISAIYADRRDRRARAARDNYLRSPRYRSLRKLMEEMI